MPLILAWHQQTSHRIQQQLSHQIWYRDDGHGHGEYYQQELSSRRKDIPLALRLRNKPLLQTLLQERQQEGQQQLQLQVISLDPLEKKKKKKKETRKLLVSKRTKRVEVSTAQELRHEIWVKQQPLQNIKVNIPIMNKKDTETQQQQQQQQPILSSQVLDLIASRHLYKQQQQQWKTQNASLPNQHDEHDDHDARHKPKPLTRHPNDTATLALCIEGGGMRGAVSAGMATALCCLNVIDVFDSIYGSSAGSVIGAYMVSRQLDAIDVYTTLLPKAREFVSKKRIAQSLAQMLWEQFWNQGRGGKQTATPTSSNTSSTTPGMNISYILNGIMHHEHGSRPLDLKRFRHNSQQQPLNIVSSCVDGQTGQLVNKCFRMNEIGDDNENALYEALKASMTVPGVAGPPVSIKSNNNNNNNIVDSCFDAFCLEPIPYRSAVAVDNATHCLVLCTRPESYQPKTQQGWYERFLAPLYFAFHGLGAAARFFARGGQQYIYTEDLLLLAQAKRQVQQKVQSPRGETGTTLANHKTTTEKPIPIPPPQPWYGADKEHRSLFGSAENEKNWKSAFLMPIQAPFGTPELGTIEQDPHAVLNAVREGFAAAFDTLAPVLSEAQHQEQSLTTSHELTGMELAKLIFPDTEDNAMTNPIRIRTRESNNKVAFSTHYQQQLAFYSNPDKGTLHHRQDHALKQHLPGISHFFPHLLAEEVGREINGEMQSVSLV